MIVQPDNAASSSTMSQAERDEIDNKAVQEAWLSLAGTLQSQRNRASPEARCSIPRSTRLNI